MAKSKDKPEATASAPVVYTHVVTAQMEADREKRKKEARAKLAAMSEKEREEYVEARRKLREKMREKYKDSPRRIVKRTRSEDGTLTLERADGTVEIHKIVKPGAKPEGDKGGK